jgi:gluconate kinase
MHVVVSGLPASGKSTIGRTLAERLELPFLDKDDFLEARFAAQPVPTPADRTRLSRECDAAFFDAARAASGAVLCSHWRWPDTEDTSGTPTDWLRDLPGVVVEVHCVCSPDTAARRFVQRQRHPAHHDERFTEAELRSIFAVLASRGPLHIGRLVTVDTDRDVDDEGLQKRVEQAITPSRRGARGPD